MNDPDLKLGDFDFTVEKIGYAIPLSCCIASLDVECDHPPAPSLPLRTRVRWRAADLWERRPRIHLGPCNHDDCC